MFLAMIIYAIPRPWAGILVWSWLGYMNPHRLAYGFVYTFPFAAITVGVILLGMIFTSEPKRLPLTRETLTLMLFMAWFTFTTFFALNPEGAWPGWNRSFKIELMILVTMMVMRERRRLHLLVWAIVLSLGFYGVKGGIYGILSGGSKRVEGPPDSFIAGNNEIALALVMIIPLMRYLQLQTEDRRVYRGLIAGQVLTVFAILCTYSRAGFLAITAVLLLIALKSRKRVEYTALIIISAGLLIKFMPDEWSQRMGTIKTYEQDSSAMGRINAWHFAYNLASDHPITGGGFAVFTRDLFHKYAPDPLDHHDAHSIYFQLLAEQGYPGLGIFLLLGLFSWGSASWTIRHAANLPEMVWASDLCGMCQVSLAGYAVGGAFAGLAYFDLPYHLMAMIVLCKALVREAERQAEDSADKLDAHVPGLLAGGSRQCDVSPPLA
jgi:probable O-glycosylation ligase (exosortase A-associated)